MAPGTRRKSADSLKEHAAGSGSFPGRGAYASVPAQAGPGAVRQEAVVAQLAATLVIDGEAVGVEIIGHCDDARENMGPVRICPKATQEAGTGDLSLDTVYQFCWPQRCHKRHGRPKILPGVSQSICTSAAAMYPSLRMCSEK
jgi:hypothetical protein